ncbi:integrative conjugative element protein, RAQPRD family, partial [Salmonella enterica]|nr:integrative conjugative element protein, RAQPRD family [Salmonella enterica]
RATKDLRAMQQGISQYLEPSRAQPRLPEGDVVSGQYRRERP